MTARNPRSIAQRTKALQHEAIALAGRAEGKTFQQIADESDMSGKSTAKRAYDRAIARLVTEPAKEARDRQLMQISEAMTVWFPKMLAGDERAALVMDRLWKRQAALEGLDAPTNHHLIVTDQVTAEIERLAAELGVVTVPESVPVVVQELPVHGPRL